MRLAPPTPAASRVPIGEHITGDGASGMWAGVGWPWLALPALAGLVASALSLAVRLHDWPISETGGRLAAGLLASLAAAAAGARLARRWRGGPPAPPLLWGLAACGLASCLIAWLAFGGFPDTADE